MKNVADVIIEGIDELVTVDPGDDTREEGDLGLIRDGAVALGGGEILAVGRSREITETYRLTKGGMRLNGQGQVLLPGFVDPHTHVVFGGSREHEFEMRICGSSYQEIAARGGGIRATVSAVRQTPAEELLEAGLRRLDRMLCYGTTTAEAKSGYGLSLESEIKLLEVARDLNDRHPVDLVSTFLGAHEVPEEYVHRKEEYIDLLVDEMIPEVVRRDLAEFCDVFCEEGVYTREESRRILSSASKAGLKPKIHADEFTNQKGAELAVEIGATSADHLLAISGQGLNALRESRVIPVLLPGTCFSLGLDSYAPAREMLQWGLKVALGTDLNPGSSMTESMPMITTLACVMLHMTPAEAIVGATLNAALAVDRADQVGSVTQGKKADLILLDMPSFRYLPYHYGVNLVDKVIKNGRLVVDGGRRVQHGDNP
ncbi:MAG: imidazolonepropionase [Candidatus Eisenbacteria sp.]|nr:imidazolonepropionase [Candidatus Eisenbacteria bacterium]